MLKGKTAVITGCLSGIGLATLDLFAENCAGGSIFACVMEITDEFTEHIENLKKRHGIEITPVCFDLNDDESIKSAMKTILGFKKPIDVLANIAGITHNALFSMTTADNYRKIFNIDFTSQMLISQYMAKAMSRQKSGSIIFVSSTTGIDGNAGQTAYAAAKAALLGAVKTMAIELGEQGVRVNAVAPGVIETPMTKALTEEKFNELAKKAVLGRVGKPEEVAKVILYLGSDLASYITGQTIRIDGGM